MGVVVIMLSGYQQQPQVRAHLHLQLHLHLHQVRADLTAKVVALGGQVVEGVIWRESITHVVANNFMEFKETVLGALVAGR